MVLVRDMRMSMGSELDAGFALLNDWLIGKIELATLAHRITHNSPGINPGL